MPTSPSNTASSTAAANGNPEPLPFLLTQRQGEAGRSLLNYVASLLLPGPDAQLLAVVVAIRAAHGGTGNLTGLDLASLRLRDAQAAVSDLRALGWQLPDTVFSSGPTDPPTPVTVPDLAEAAGRPLPFGNKVRSRVSGWTTKVLSVKSIKKLPPDARLASLFLAAHASPGLLGTLPPHLPAACRDALPLLLEKGFLAELSDDRYRLAPQVRHLSGMRTPTDEEKAELPHTSVRGVRGFWFHADVWEQWKAAATPALRRHVESVEHCELCRLGPDQVAEAFSGPNRPMLVSQRTQILYRHWKDNHPDRGPLSAAFTVAFRAEHGHGPSFRQLGKGMGWGADHQLRGLAVQRLMVNGWLTSTGSVPWTLRPGMSAQKHGITLPAARNAKAAAPSS
ncbi:hypothetical protein [Streptomyces sp. NPDC050600]|uniref:hypothetical protein n=1 Tax=Streptomyces sp. NPDC050600 TaxID=3157213 RepID=UPI003422CD6B